MSQSIQSKGPDIVAPVKKQAPSYSIEKVMLVVGSILLVGCLSSAATLYFLHVPGIHIEHYVVLGAGFTLSVAFILTAISMCLRKRELSRKIPREEIPTNLHVRSSSSKPETRPQALRDEQSLSASQNNARDGIEIPIPNEEEPPAQVANVGTEVPVQSRDQSPQIPVRKKEEETPALPLDRLVTVKEIDIPQPCQEKFKATPSMIEKKINDNGSCLFDAVVFGNEQLNKGWGQFDPQKTAREQVVKWISANRTANYRLQEKLAQALFEDFNVRKERLVKEIQGYEALLAVLLMTDEESEVSQAETIQFLENARKELDQLLPTWEKLNGLNAEIDRLTPKTLHASITNSTLGRQVDIPEEIHKEIDDYLIKMMNPETFGGASEVFALSCLLKKTIKIIAIEGKRYSFDAVQVINGEFEEEGVIWLLKYPNHYNLLIPKN